MEKGMRAHRSKKHMLRRYEHIEWDADDDHVGRTPILDGRGACAAASAAYVYNRVLMPHRCGIVRISWRAAKRHADYSLALSLFHPRERENFHSIVTPWRVCVLYYMCGFRLTWFARGLLTPRLMRDGLLVTHQRRCLKSGNNNRLNPPPAHIIFFSARIDIVNWKKKNNFFKTIFFYSKRASVIRVVICSIRIIEWGSRHTSTSPIREATVIIFPVVVGRTHIYIRKL